MNIFGLDVFTYMTALNMLTYIYMHPYNTNSSEYNNNNNRNSNSNIFIYPNIFSRGNIYMFQKSINNSRGKHKENQYHMSVILYLIKFRLPDFYGLVNFI